MLKFSQAEKEKFMSEALKEAQKAAKNEEVPIGTIIVQYKTKKLPSGLFERDESFEPRIIARSFNRREIDQQASHHAEICAITEANEKIENWRLLDCAMFVTVEPCLMCAGAIGLARISELYYGSANPKFGAVESLYQVLTDPRLNHRVEIEGGILSEDCAQIMQTFFRSRRKK